RLPRHGGGCELPRRQHRVPALPRDRRPTPQGRRRSQEAAQRFREDHARDRDHPLWDQDRRTASRLARHPRRHAGVRQRREPAAIGGRALILAVDRNQRNLDLLTDLLSKKGYETRGAVTLEEFDGALEGERDISLALVDVAGFDPAIWQRCDRL